jgi:hypothetical protein
VRGDNQSNIFGRIKDVIVACFVLNSYHHPRSSLRGMCAHVVARLTLRTLSSNTSVRWYPRLASCPATLARSDGAGARDRTCKAYVDLGDPGALNDPGRIVEPNATAGHDCDAPTSRFHKSGLRFHTSQAVLFSTGSKQSFCARHTNTFQRAKKVG